MQKLKISIIVPVYNVEKYLSICIESILNQTFMDYELLLIDDGSTDASGDICDKYALKYENVFVFHQNNAGVSEARNFGIREARGQYITFVDSDDWLEPNYLEHLVTYMVPGGFVAAHLTMNDGVRLKKDKLQKVSKAETQISIFSSHGIRGFAGAKIFDRRVLRKNGIFFCKDIAICEDELFSIMYVSAAENEMVLLEQSGYHYRVNSGGATLGRYRQNPPRKKDFTEILALERAEKYLENNEKVRKVWEQRRDKAAVATLRTMVSCNYDNVEEINRLKKIIRNGCLRYLLGNVGSVSGKISMLLSAISPQLEWKIYEKRHIKM